MVLAGNDDDEIWVSNLCKIQPNIYCHLLFSSSRPALSSTIDPQHIQYIRHLELKIQMPINDIVEIDILDARLRNRSQTRDSDT